jgi:predicted DNA-binding transcriptional regulator AlpA
MHIVSTAPQSLAAQDSERLLRETEAADFLGYSVRALQNWRVRGGGPLFVKVSARSVRYRRADLLAWTQARIRRSTSDIGPEAIR